MTVNAIPATKPSTAELIRSSAIDLFFEHGYEATSLRAIAGEVGIQVGSLYNHLTSKESLLYSIMSTIMEDLLREFDSRLAVVTDSVERLRAAIEVHVFFHTARAREVFIGNSELRSLTAAHRRKVVKLRDQYEERFVDIIERGVADGSFEAPDPKTHRLGDPRRRHEHVDVVPARRPAAARRHRRAVHRPGAQRPGKRSLAAEPSDAAVQPSRLRGVAPVCEAAVRTFARSGARGGLEGRNAIGGGTNDCRKDAASGHRGGAAGCRHRRRGNCSGE